MDFIERNADEQAEIVHRIFKYQYANQYSWPELIEIERFSNGREQGYTYRIIRYPICEISIAEQRNGDGIVLYPFEWAGETKEDDYFTKTLELKPERWEDAALLIFAQLTGGLICHEAGEDQDVARYEVDENWTFGDTGTLRNVLAGARVGRGQGRRGRFPGSTSQDIVATRR